MPGSLPKSPSLLALLAALLLPAAGPATAQDMPTYTVTFQDGRSLPETITVPAGVRFRLQATNKGPGPAEFESIELRKESVLAVGVTRNVVFAPLKPGSYAFFDDFHPDTARGRIVAR
jgi:hypothetical protein